MMSRPGYKIKDTDQSKKDKKKIREEQKHYLLQPCKSLNNH